jgi:hypothetical protein
MENCMLSLASSHPSRRVSTNSDAQQARGTWWLESVGEDRKV